MVFTAYVAFDLVFAVWDVVVIFSASSALCDGWVISLFSDLSYSAECCQGFCSSEEVSMLVKRVDCEDNGGVCLVGYFTFWANPTW